MTEPDPSQTGLVAFALSYQSLSGELPENERRLFADGDGEAAYLGPMTGLFRQSFRSIFKSARQFAVSGAELEVPGAKVRLIGCHVFSGSGSGIGDGDNPDRLLVALAEVDSGDEDRDFCEAWRAVMKPVAAKQDLLRRSGLATLLDCLTVENGRVIGHTSCPITFAPDKRERTIAAIYAFYVLGWFSAMRIARRQLALKLAPVAAMSDEESVSIADQRMRIINQQRYFLGNDRTNHLDLREFCRILVDKYKLQSRFDRSLTLHESFEHHLDNSAKLHNARKLGSVSNLILILTVLSVPISAFSAIFAINLKSEALDRPWAIMSDYRLYVALAVGALWVALPFILLKLADRMRD